MAPNNFSKVVADDWIQGCCNGQALDREVTLAEVAKHDTAQDCWIVLYNVVYDMTPFLSMHPGGMEILLENAGRDATLSYQDVGHNKEGLALLQHLRVGVLPVDEMLPTFW